MAHLTNLFVTLVACTFTLGLLSGCMGPGPAESTPREEATGRPPDGEDQTPAAACEHLPFGTWDENYRYISEKWSRLSNDSGLFAHVHQSIAAMALSNDTTHFRAKAAGPVIEWSSYPPDQRPPVAHDLLCLSALHALGRPDHAGAPTTHLSTLDDLEQATMGALQAERNRQHGDDSERCCLVRFQGNLHVLELQEYHITRPPAPVNGTADITGGLFDPIYDAGNLSNEWVRVSNRGLSAMNLTGWTLMNDRNTTFTFPPGFTLASDASVRVRTGTGHDTTTDLFWNQDAAVWDDEHDRARLFDSEGRLQQEWSPEPR